MSNKSKPFSKITTIERRCTLIAHYEVDHPFRHSILGQFFCAQLVPPCRKAAVESSAGHSRARPNDKIAMHQEPSGRIILMGDTPRVSRSCPLSSYCRWSCRGCFGRRTGLCQFGYYGARFFEWQLQRQGLYPRYVKHGLYKILALLSTPHLYKCF